MKAAAEVSRESVTTMNSIVPSWTKVEYKEAFSGCLEAFRFEAMFSDCRNAIIYGRRGVRRNTDIGRWN